MNSCTKCNEEFRKVLYHREKEKFFCRQCIETVVYE